MVFFSPYFSEGLCWCFLVNVFFVCVLMVQRWLWIDMGTSGTSLRALLQQSLRISALAKSLQGFFLGVLIGLRRVGDFFMFGPLLSGTFPELFEDPVCNFVPCLTG